MAINFFSKEIKSPEIKKIKIKSWIKQIAKNENKLVGDINIVFTDNKNILEINNKFLNHNYFTDIITFDYSKHNSISGELFISIDTVKENATLFNQEYIVELHRVIAHGILHLIGYNDKKPMEKTMMKEKEDFCLNMYLNI